MPTDTTNPLTLLIMLTENRRFEYRSTSKLTIRSL